MIQPNELLSDEQLLAVLATSNNAIAIHVTDKFNIQFASQPMLDVWGKGNGVIGKPLEEALPELKGQPFIDLFKKVWNDGITVSGTDTLATLEIGGELQDFYFDFEYRAIKNSSGKTYCILHSANDVTERYIAKQRAQDLTEELSAINEELVASNEELMATNEELLEAQKKEQSLAEELSAMNEELSAANEELMSTNEELQEAHQNVRETYDDLIESDARFRNMVKQAPVGICVITAGDLFIQEVNDNYLELVGKTREEMDGRTIWEAVPEAADVYAPVMNEVINTGMPFYATEHELTLIRNGVPENVFVDFVYEPVRQVEGPVIAIMVLAIDVSEKVMARRSIEEVEERIRLAVEAAEIGTFDLDIPGGIMLTSERFNTIFGFNEHVPWRRFVAAIHPDDQDLRAKAHREAYEHGKLFYELRVIHGDDSIHWIRVQGQVYYDINRKPARMLGTLLDITQVKRLEQQKDDFISIASHELKTPITSLKASLQLLERMKDNPSATMLPKLIDQAGRSMGKISTLVNDLLNVSRSTDQQLKLNKTTFSIHHLLQNCCNHVRVAGKYTLTIKGDEHLQVHADEHAIDQVVVNFVNNAVKYAPESLEIFMKIEKQDDMAKISVTDTGPGIPPDKLPHLFERYYQAEAGGFQNSGLGLGLYISAGIIKRHNGQIGVDSELGKGSTFWFTLPLA